MELLQGLTSLSKELAENSGINDPFTDLMENGLEDGGLDDLSLKLLDRSGRSFNFSRMLHNSLCPRSNIAVN
jgi:hypothetical protein